MSSEKIPEHEVLERQVLASLERVAEAFESLDEMKVALREGKRLPVSGNPTDWPSLKARIEALLTPDEATRKLFEDVARLIAQDAQ